MDPVLSVGLGSNSVHKGPDRITYTWSDINGYCTTNNARAWDHLFNRKTPVEQKHILKDGATTFLSII